jgi:hypothetical protein
MYPRQRKIFDRMYSVDTTCLFCVFLLLSILAQQSKNKMACSVHVMKQQNEIENETAK